MTKQLITEAIEKLVEAQESLNITGENVTKETLKAEQKHYEISKAISELKYVLSTMNRQPFLEDRVEAESVADFLDRYYRPERYRGRDQVTPSYSEGLLKSYESAFQREGYVFISQHDSITGRTVSYYG